MLQELCQISKKKKDYSINCIETIRELSRKIKVESLPESTHQKSSKWLKD